MTRAGPGKERFGVIDIGLNPAVHFRSPPVPSCGRKLEQ